MKKEIEQSWRALQRSDNYPIALQPGRLEPRAQLSDQIGSKGGFTVTPVELIDAVELGLASSCMRRLAEVVRVKGASEVGFTAAFIGEGDSGHGELLAENAEPTIDDLDFSKLNLNSYKFGSKASYVPSELFQDAPDKALFSLITGFARRIARQQNFLFTVGRGASQPQGIVQGVVSAGAVTVTSSNSGRIVWSDLVNLFASLNSVYWEDETNQPRFMMHPATYASILLGTLDAEGGYQVQSVLQKILGEDIIFNPDMPTLTSGNIPVLFGDFGYFKIRDVAEVRFLKSWEAAGAAENDSYLCWSTLRSDGALFVPDSERPPVVGLQVQ